MKLHKKYIVMSFALAVGLFPLYLGAVYLLANTPNHEILWVNNCVIKKESIAKGIKKPKIVFSGGSATLFGIRTNTIEQEFNKPSVNLAVHAELQIDYIIYRAKKVLKRGDIAVLTPEHHLYFSNGELHKVKSRYVKAYDVEYFQKLPLKEKLSYFYSVGQSDFLKNLKNYLIFDNKEPTDGTEYNSVTLNENGDETSNVSNEKTRKMLLKIRPMVIQKVFTETYALKVIKDFNMWCRENNIKFYLAFPPTVYFKEYDSNEYKNYFGNLQRYFNENAIKMIGSPNYFFYDISLFYDTEYHLNQEGAVLNTKRLIDRMKEANVLN